MVSKYFIVFKMTGMGHITGMAQQGDKQRKDVIELLGWTMSLLKLDVVKYNYMLIGNSRFGIEIVSFDLDKKYGNYQLKIMDQCIGNVEEYSLIYILRNELHRIILQEDSEINLSEFLNANQLFDKLTESNYEHSFVGVTFDEFTIFCLKQSESVLICWKSYKSESDEICLTKVLIEDVVYCLASLDKFLHK